VHLVGDTRHGVDDLLSDRADQARCRTHRLWDQRRPFWHIGLPAVVLRHLTTARGEHRPDALEHLRISPQRDVHHFGDRLTGDVVLRRTEASAHDDGVAAGEGRTEGKHDAGEVVADRSLEMAVQAGSRQLLADVGGIRIDDLTEQQLGPDGDDLSTHEASGGDGSGCAGGTGGPGEQPPSVVQVFEPGVERDGDCHPQQSRHETEMVLADRRHEGEPDDDIL
jgi:hypothetical protein